MFNVPHILMNGTKFLLMSFQNISIIERFFILNLFIALIIVLYLVLRFDSN